MMTMQLLAQAAAAPPSDNFSVAGLLAILGALGTLVAGIGAVIHGKNQKAVGVKEQRERDSVTLTNAPLGVKMEDHFVTRREFDHFRSETRLDSTDMKNLFEKTMTEIKSVNANLSENIEEGVKEGRLGRVAIWNEVNPLGKKIAVIEDRQNVAEQIGKLADAIKSNGKNPPGR